MIVQYRLRQLTLIQTHSTTLPHMMQVSPPIPSPYTIHISSPEPEVLPTALWSLDRLSEDIPPNPPNTPVHFPQ
jgi:hypothetical protein